MGKCDVLHVSDLLKASSPNNPAHSLTFDGPNQANTTPTTTITTGGRRCGAAGMIGGL
jgi:hypothetical protein